MLNYSIVVKIDPGQQTLEAEATVTFPADWDKPKFCLHRDLKLDALEGATGYRFTEDTVPFVYEARCLDLELPEGIAGPHTATFKYHGKLGIISEWETNRITPEWTELGLYTPWYPLSVPMQNAVFSVEVQVPSQYSVLSTGDTVKKDGCWQIEQSVPALDCTLIIARDFRVREAEPSGAAVRTSFIEARAEPAAEAFARIGAEVLEWCNACFGPTDVNPVDIVIVPREKGGGYARRGFIVFEADLDLDNYNPLYRYIAHEFSHLWWYKADTSTWEDWLNESLAEFSALMAVRDLLGPESFDKMLAFRQKKAENLPPIKGIDRQDDEAHAVLYHKGCVFLAELEAEMGKDKFLTFLRLLLQRQIATTELFLATLAEIGGDAAAQGFAAKLES